MKTTREYFLPLTEKQKDDLETLEIEAEIEAKKITDNAWLDESFRKMSANNFFVKSGNIPVNSNCNRLR